MQRIIYGCGRILAAALMLSPMGVRAHHSPNVHFDRSEVIEIEGELTELRWRNPHVQLTVETTDEQGETSIWEVEYLAPSFLSRQGISRDLFIEGETLRVAGYLGRSNKAAIFSTNILLPNGQEVFDFQISQARWTDDTVGVTFGEYQQEKLQDVPEIQSSLFRVWSTDVSYIGPDRALWKESYPLTEQAVAEQASWDRIGENPYMRCQNGMPAIMDQFYPMEIVAQGEDILIYLEELDSVRRVYMTPGTEPDGSSPFGHSVGQWDDDALVVTTTHINWPWFDQTGIRQTQNVSLTERFTPSAEGHRLDYSVTVTDPATFTEPVTLSRSWIWVPGESVQPYNCTVSEENY